MKRLLSFLCVFLLFLCFAGSGHAELMNSNGRLYYMDGNNRKAVQVGVDVSFYNNQIDWVALKEQGIDFVIIRLGGRGWGTGRVYDDSMAQIYLRGAREADLNIGAYFYSTAVNPSEAVEEAEAALADLNGLRLDLPLFIDMELSGDIPNGRADTISEGTRTEIIEAFCRTVEAAGYRSGVYSAQGYFIYNIDTPPISYLPIWLASYTVDNLLPDYRGKYDIWQYTDAGFIGGIDGPVDMNVIFADG